MTTMTGQSVIRQPRPSSLADVLDLILDKGLVIDAYVRVSLVGIELVTIDARIVVASVDTYLRFASMTNRMDLKSSDNSEGLPQLMHDMLEGGASDKTQGALSGAAKQFSSWFGGDDDSQDDGDQSGENGQRRRRRPERARASSSSRSSRDNGNGRSRDTQRRRRRSDDGGER